MRTYEVQFNNFHQLWQVRDIDDRCPIIGSSHCKFFTDQSEADYIALLLNQAYVAGRRDVESEQAEGYVPAGHVDTTTKNNGAWTIADILEREG